MWALNPPMTAAFDTVDHELLLLRLERQFGLCDTVLEWFRSICVAGLFVFCIRRFCVVYCSHTVLGPARVSSRATDVYLVLR